jgi:hypothetical protein
MDISVHYRFFAQKRNFPKIFFQKALTSGELSAIIYLRWKFPVKITLLEVRYAEG